MAEVVFLLERGQTDNETDATERYTHAGGYTANNNNNRIISKTASPNCLQMLRMGMALSFYEVSAIRNVLPVL